MAFKDWLLELGEGRLPQVDGEIEVPRQFHTEDVVKAIFGETIDVSDIESLKSKVILRTTNDTTTYLNSKVCGILLLRTVSICQKMIVSSFAGSATDSGRPKNVHKYGRA